MGVVTMTCYRCGGEAARVCQGCRKPFCPGHGGQWCLDCTEKNRTLYSLGSIALLASGIVLVGLSFFAAEVDALFALFGCVLIVGGVGGFCHAYLREAP